VPLDPAAPPQRIIGDLLTAEINEKQARSSKYQLSIAKLPLAKDLDDFQFDGTPINETLVRDLAGGGFLAQQRNVVLIGGTGTGKTHPAIVTAPYDGVVTERHVDVGDLVPNGGTLLYRMAQYEKVRVFANVAQLGSGKIGTGSLVRVTASEYPDRVFEGKVTRTSESIDLRAHAARRSRYAKQGSRPASRNVCAGRVRSQAGQHCAGARKRDAASNRGPQVAVVDATGTVKFNNVTIGRDNGNFVEIASGLAEGDRVVLNINSQIADGDQVTVRDDKTDGQ
jgi:hypothetical protein